MADLRTVNLAEKTRVIIVRSIDIKMTNNMVLPIKFAGKIRVETNRRESCSSIPGVSAGGIDIFR